MKLSKENLLLLAEKDFIDTIAYLARMINIEVENSEIYLICTGKTVPRLNVRETISIHNLKEAYLFVLNTMEILNVDISFLFTINQIVGFNIYSMATYKEKIYRNLKDFEQKINELVASIDNVEKAIDFMLFLIKTGVFNQCNTRTAILCTNRILIEKGFGIFHINDEDMDSFKEKLLKTMKTKETDELKSFILEKCIKTIKKEDEEKLEFWKQFKEYEAMKNVH